MRQHTFGSIFGCIARAVLLVAGLWSMAAPASDIGNIDDIGREVKFDIPAQSLLSALYQFSSQARVQVVTRAADISGASTKGVQGKLAVSKGLGRLLQGTGFSFEVVDDSTIAIKSSEAKKADVSAQLQQLPPLQLAQNAAPASPGVAAPATVADEQAAPIKGVPEMLVKGRRSINSDIRRTEDDVQPYVVFDAETIERSMATNLEQFLKTHLPMNTVAASNNQDEVGGYGNQSSVDLRGLGANQTLILINGRRAPAISNSTLLGNFGQPDLNGIPISAVERIEILPSTASGIYGGGATGGVVNVILKRDYQGIEVKGRYENSFASDISQRGIEVNAGFSLEGGKTSIMVSGSYSDSNELQVGERDFYQRSRALLERNNPTYLLEQDFDPTPGYTTNISGFFGEPLVLDGGIPLNSSYTHIPVGYRGMDIDGVQALIDNAGTYNLDLPNDLNGRQASLLSNPTVESYGANIRRTFGEYVEAFVDVSRFRNLGRTFSGDAFVGVTLNADAPNNPFESDVLVTFPTPGLSAGATSLSQTTQASGGLLVRLPRNWTLQGDYSWNESRNAFRGSDGVFGLVNDAGVAAVSDGTLDVMRDLNLDPIDFSSYRLASPNFISGPSETVLQDASLRLAGQLFTLPGGAVTVSAVLERREQEMKPAYQVQPSFFDPAGELETYYYPARRQDVDSLYVETLVPLFSQGNALPFVHSLEAQVSVRRDDYATDTVALGQYPVDAIGDVPTGPIERTLAGAASTDYTFGLRYAPNRAVALRVSYGTGFLPPSIEQLVALNVPAFRPTTIQDPRNNGAIYSTRIATRRIGNPDLVPEESRSLSAGIILTPAAIEGLRVSMDYTRIRKSDEITFLDQGTIINNELLLPGRVGRAALTPEDMMAGLTYGRINFIDLSLINTATTAIDSYDVQGDYLWETPYGEFNAYLLATWQPHFKRRLTGTAAVVEYAGNSGNSALKWRGNGGINWRRGPLTIAWNLQYYDSYLVFRADDSVGTVESKVLNQGSDTIPRQVYHDLLAEYRFEQAGRFGSLLADTELTVGIQNVFDKVPPVIASGRLYGSYSFYGDPRLRRYSISLRKSFR